MNTTSRRRRISTLTATVIGALALALGPGGTAHAASQAFFSGFESGDGSNWQFTHSGPGSSSLGFGVTHSGARRATLTMLGTGFASAGHRVQLTAGSTCLLSGFIRPEAPGVVNMEVIDPATFGYIALRTLTFTQAGDYQFKNLAWTKGKTDVLIRFSLGTTSGTFTQAGLDDVSVACL